jgi:hypothetical protein
VGGDDSSGEAIRIEPYMPYQPRPIDDSSVKLPEDLDRITDRLAENAHEIWAAKRLAEGWKLGPKNDGSLEETPSWCRMPSYLSQRSSPTKTSSWGRSGPSSPSDIAPRNRERS